MKTIMKQTFLLAIATFLITTLSYAKSNIIGEEVTYTSNGVTMKSYVAYDANQKGKRPAIVVIPEWWGNTEYAKKRARMLAELGYIAMATDMYGDGKVATEPKTAQEYATPFYKDPTLGKARIEAAIGKLKEYGQTDTRKIAAIGYCFGGSMALNAAKLGSDLVGTVCFHGGLTSASATKGSVKGKILVCNGAADKFVSAEEIANFKKNMDTTGVTYTFINYPDATHAFTNPESTANGKKFNMPIAYNEAADKKSWEDMKVFFKTIF